MTKAALVFAGRNGLDFVELRAGVLRIPEVILRLRQAQEIVDRHSADGRRVDLINIMTADDEFFFRNIQMKSLLSAIVQVGLFDRFQKSNKAKSPQFIVGNSSGDSAMKVCVGLQSFESMVENSQAVSALQASDVVVPMVAPAAPLLSGLALTEYQAFEAQSFDGETQYMALPAGIMEIRKLVSSLYQEQGVVRFVNIGPSSLLRGSDYRAIGDGEIEFVDSIDLDAMLSWFWRGVRMQAMALAN